jgi:hypothetical protein
MPSRRARPKDEDRPLGSNAPVAVTCAVDSTTTVRPNAEAQHGRHGADVLPRHSSGLSVQLMWHKSRRRCGPVPAQMWIGERARHSRETLACDCSACTWLTQCTTAGIGLACARSRGSCAPRRCCHGTGQRPPSSTAPESAPINFRWGNSIKFCWGKFR